MCLAVESPSAAPRLSYLCLSSGAPVLPQTAVPNFSVSEVRPAARICRALPHYELSIGFFERWNNYASNTLLQLRNATSFFNSFGGSVLALSNTSLAFNLRACVNVNDIASNMVWDFLRSDTSGGVVQYLFARQRQGTSMRILTFTMGDSVFFDRHISYLVSTTELYPAKCYKNASMLFPCALLLFAKAIYIWLQLVFMAFSAVSQSLTFNCMYELLIRERCL